MGFRVVDKSSFTFETDLPPSSRNIHPSGVLHAFRSTTASPTNTVIGTNASGREEHTFAWISNALHAESAIKHLEKHGFDRSCGIVFIPYSTKRNWLDRYPHAAPALETTEEGKVVVYLNWRPYPNGLGQLGGSDADPGVVFVPEAAVSSSGGEVDDNVATTAGTTGEKKRVNKSRAINMLQDNSYMPDAPREELHIEIYNYLSWLHAKLDALEKKAEAAVAVKVAKDAATNSANEGEEQEQGQANKTAATAGQKRKSNIGVDVSQLGEVVNKLETTFAIIPNAKLDAMPIADEEMADPSQVTTSSATAAEQESAPMAVSKSSKAGGGRNASDSTPFLEEALSKALNQLVAARELAGKPRRRSKKRRRKSDNSKPGGHSRVAPSFDDMYERLAQYKAKFGDCIVSKNYEKDPQLANWVRGLREKKAILLRKGVEGPEAPKSRGSYQGGESKSKTLTAERIEKLDKLGFQWIIAGPKVSWEDRFKDTLEYYEANGKWPSQSMGSIGEWVHKQRTLYARGDKNYMTKRAPKLDEVGFEWTPRGNTKMSWDEGFELLMAFGKQNGHFNVPCPSNSGVKVDVKSEEHRLYKWTESLHKMYRSYKLGRKSGSLNDDRVVLLIKHGFVFRN